MNKIIIIALGALLVIGIGYQAKRTYDSHHAAQTAGTNSTNSNGANSNDTKQNGQAATGTTGNAGGAALNVNETTSTSGTTATSGTPSTSGTSNGVTSTQNAVSAHSNPVNGQTTPPTGKAGMDAGTNSSAGTTASKSGSAKTEKPKDNCFAFEYRHKKEAKDQDIENFLDYTNAFPVAHADFNPKSVCVKVNQKVVPFTLAKVKSDSEIRVGSMVGPESVIRVTYCTGKIPLCHEACDQPKKRFMDDLMSDAADDDSFSDSWGKDENHKKELKNKAKELRTIASENDHLNESSIQRDWDELQKQEWVCK